MTNKEQLLKEMRILEKEIELEKSFNEYSSNLSFMEYQLNELKKELENEESQNNVKET